MKQLPGFSIRFEIPVCYKTQQAIPDQVHKPTHVPRLGGFYVVNLTWRIPSNPPFSRRNRKFVPRDLDNPASSVVTFVLLEQRFKTTYALSTPICPLFNLLLAVG